MVSISQWIYSKLPSDAEMGTMPKALNNTAKDLQRFAKQSDSGLASFGYKTLGAVFELGRGISTPFEQTSKDCDRLARQSDSTLAKVGYSTVGAFFSLGSKAFRLPHDLAMGTVDFVADPLSTIASMPEAVQQNGDAMLNGGLAITDGKISSGVSQLLEGAVGDTMIVLAAFGMAKMTGAAATLRLSPENIAAKQTLQRILAADDAAFAQAWENTAPAGQLGAIEIPQWMLPALGKADYLKLFRQATVSNAELEVLVQHADANVSAAAKQVFVERTSPVPVGYVQIPPVPVGYVQIPGGELKGQAISPFAMKATLVTNVEWFQGLDGKPRYVTLEWNQTTHAVVVKDISTTPPAFLNPKLNLEAGEIATQGSQVLVKLVDNPSQAYDAVGRIFSGGRQPVVGVNYFHAQAWVQAQTLEVGGRHVFKLPTDLQYEWVASEGGTVGAAVLYDASGRKLFHFDEWNGDEGTTVAVDDPRYPQGPSGIQKWGNAWRWIEANPQGTYPYGLRGGSWYSNSPEFLRAAFRYNCYIPVGRGNDVGFSPVALPGLPKK